MLDNVPSSGNLGVKTALDARANDGKCYFPCNRCRGYNRRILLIKITKKHCTRHGHSKGWNGYYPMVIFSLNIFIVGYCFCKSL